MYKTIISIICLFFAISSHSIIQSEQAPAFNIEVSKYQVRQREDNKVDLHPFISNFGNINMNFEYYPREALDILFEIKVDEKTHNFIMEHNEIPIRFKWYKSLGLSLISIGSRKAEVLSTEKKEDGFFSMIIVCEIPKILEIRWIIKIVFLLDNTPVYCITDNNERTKCILNLDLSRKFKK